MPIFTFDPGNLKPQLKRDEGNRPMMYTDSTGHRTIGVGHNLDARPLSQQAIDQILDDDLHHIMAEIAQDPQLAPIISTLSANRQMVLVNMAFNLGVGGLKNFRVMLNKLAVSDYSRAAEAMLNSLWARQVGARAQRLADTMRQG
ncbi:MAG: glycoside hydrolase family protein [Magnetococcales bacterium]|nr:glycoside hydrolase family protein [Magnetococcales bacterium]MBF0114719.1 glycoside hydrolase family protein [Magnetococcales bacterium]